jgi:hypothetical protein
VAAGSGAGGSFAEVADLAGEQRRLGVVDEPNLPQAKRREMIGWLRSITGRFPRLAIWLVMGRAFLTQLRAPRPPRSDDIARRAIQWLREAELDFHRCGQLGLSRIYRERAARLERELTSG